MLEAATFLGRMLADGLDYRVPAVQIKTILASNLLGDFRPRQARSPPSFKGISVPRGRAQRIGNLSSRLLFPSNGMAEFSTVKRRRLL